MPVSENFEVKTNAPTLVLDSAANIVLNNIYKFLQNQSKEYSAADAIDDLTKEQKSENKKQDSNRKKSEANNRAVQNALKGISKSDKVATKNRAVQNALLNNIKRNAENDIRNRAVQNALFGKTASNINDNVKNLFDNIKSFLTPYLDKSLSHFTNMAKMMRMQNLTASEKHDIGLAASTAFRNTEKMFNVKVAQEDIEKYYNELVAGGKDVRLMTEEQQAAYAALRARGMSDEKAWTVAATANQETIKQLTNAMTDPRTAAVISQSVSNLQDFQLVSGGINKNLKSVISASKAAAENFGLAGLASGKSADLVKQSALASSGQLEAVSAEFAVLSKGARGSAAGMINNVRKTAETMNDTTRRAVGSMGGMFEDIANASAVIQSAKANGTATKQNTRTWEENEEAGTENSPAGMIQHLFSKAFADINIATNGALTDVGNTLDKWFGDSADISKLVKTGFSIVGLLLKKIAFNTGGSSKLLGSAGKLLGPVLGVAAIGALIANRDKLLPLVKPIVESIKGVLSNIKPILKDLISGIKESLSSLFSGGVSSLFGGSSASIGGMFSISSSGSSGSSGLNMSGLASSMSSIASDIGDGLKQALPSLGTVIWDALNGIGDLLSSLLGAGGTLISGIITALGDFLKNALPPLTDLVDVLVNGINTALKLIVPALEKIITKAIDGIVKIVEFIAPSIPDICKVLNTLIKVGIPAIQSIVETLIPYIPPILDCINEIIKTVVPVIKTLIKEISSIIQTLVKSIRDIVNTLINAVTSIANTIITSIKEVIITAINAIKTIMIEYKPIFSNIVNIIGKIVDVALPIIQDILAPALKMITTHALPIMLDILDLLWNEVAKPLFDTVVWFFTQKLPAIFNGIVDVASAGFGLISAGIGSAVDLVKSIPEMIYNKIMQWYYEFLGWFQEKLSVIIDMIARIGRDDEDMIEYAAGMKRAADDSNKKANEYKNANQKIIDAAIAPTKAALGRFETATNNFGKTEQTLAEYREQKEAERDARRAKREGKANDNSEDSFSALQESLATITKLLTAAVSTIPKILSDISEIIAIIGKKVMSTLNSISDGVFNIFMSTDLGQQQLGEDQIESFRESVSNYASSKLPIVSTFASGGIINSPTPAIVGENGREAILPLTNDDDLKTVLGKLSVADRAKLLSLLSDEQINEASSTRNASDKAAASYVAEAAKLLNNSGSKEEILAILTEIAKYIKNIANSKKTITPVSRPTISTY